MLTLTLESEVQSQDLRVARLQRSQRLGDRLRQQAPLDLDLGLSGLFSNEALDELRVLGVTDRRIETDLCSIQCLQ